MMSSLKNMRLFITGNSWQTYSILIISIFILGACGSYKQNIMFQKDESSFSPIDMNALARDSNYVIMPNDYLELQVFTKGGERVIDPELELIPDNRANVQNTKPQLQYLVRENGYVKLPMIGDIQLQGLSIFQAEQLLQEKYKVYYKEPYVYLKYLNKRVIVLGAPGGFVVPLENENMRITEVLALSEGIKNDAKVQNIRLLRGDQVFHIDLSTIEGYRNTNMTVKSGDIIYVEPVRRPFSEFVRENGPVISVFTSIVSLIVVLISIN